MTVENQDNKKRVHGDGATSTMPFSFRVLDTADLILYFVTLSTGVKVEKTPDIDYTVALEDEGEGGVITFIDIPTALEDALLINQLELTQPADLPTEGNFNEETVEIALDRCRLIDIQQQEEIDRSIKISIEDELNNDDFEGLFLPADSLSTRAGTVIGWNSVGDGLQNYVAADIDLAIVTAFVETLLDDTTASEFLSTLGVSNFIKTLLDDASATVARATLGSTTVGDALFIATSAAVARTAIGAAGLTGDETVAGAKTFTGNLAMQALLDLSNASAGQIKFPASQNASSDANTLDDYEEGTWTPVLTFQTPGNLNVAYAEQVGLYTKIGKRLFLEYSVITSTFTHTSGESGDVRMSGLPYAPLGSQMDSTAAVLFQGITKASYTQISHLTNGTNTYLIYRASGSAQAVSAVATTDMPTGGTVQLRGQINFHAST